MYKENSRTIQKKLSKEKFSELRWGSHIPMNKALLNSFSITGILELGAGTKSTPLFFKNCKNVISIESDIEWINKLKAEKIVEESATQKIVYHKVPESINRSTLRKDVPTDVLENATRFYHTFITPEINYLFVDCFAGLRLEALLRLYDKFDLIVYHDAEPEYDWCYSYSSFKPNKNYRHYIDRTFSAHVGVVISNKFSHLLDSFKNNFMLEAENYAKLFNVQHKPILEE
jgi:hypothetical protein